MELQNPSHGAELLDPSNGDGGGGGGGGGGVEDVDSSCSTPYVSAPSSPGRCGASAGWFFSAPASPMHFVLSSQPYTGGGGGGGGGGDAEFEFSARFASPGAEPPGSMISADEIFFNGQIRPMKLSSHLQRPQRLAPLLDLDAEEEDDDPVDSASSAEGARGRDLRLRSGSVHRRARSMSPLRNPSFHWHEDEEAEGDGTAKVPEADSDQKRAEGATPSASSSRSSSSSSSSSSRSSKRWIFLKDLLYRSKSEGRDRGPAKDRFWSSISFSPSSKERSKTSNPPPRPRAAAAAAAAEPKRTPRAAAAAGAGKRASAHERHYAANRAHAEEMRRRTFLPYRQGLLGCLGFSSRGFGAFHGLAKTLNPVSSRVQEQVTEVTGNVENVGNVGIGHTTSADAIVASSFTIATCGRWRVVPHTFSVPQIE